MSDEIVIKLKVDKNGRLSDMEGQPLMIGPLSEQFVLDSWMMASDGRRMRVRDLIAEKKAQAEFPGGIICPPPASKDLFEMWGKSRPLTEEDLTSRKAHDDLEKSISEEVEALRRDFVSAKTELEREIISCDRSPRDSDADDMVRDHSDDAKSDVEKTE